MSAQSRQAPPPRRYRRGLRWLRDILLFVLILAAVQWWQSRDLVKDQAPPLAGLLVDGTPYQLDSAGEHPVLVHFWAEWCPVCRLGQDSIDDIAKDHRVITIALSSGPAVEVQAFLDEHALTMPTLIDEQGDIARRWGVFGVPSTFVVDNGGAITHASQGYSTEIGLRLRLWLAGLD